MSQDPELEESIDPVTLARLFVAGRSIKRGATIQMVKELLTLLDASEHLDMSPAVWKEETITDNHLRQIAEPDASVRPPDVAVTRPPIAVHPGLAGSVFLGPDANRHFTHNEAVALADAIIRVASRSTS